MKPALMNKKSQPRRADARTANSVSVPGTLDDLPDARELSLFKALDAEKTGDLDPSVLLEVLTDCGFSPDDIRLRTTFRALEVCSCDRRLSFADFSALIRPNILLIERALQGRLVIPEFRRFQEEVVQMHGQAQENRSGHVADYIPQLARVSPDQFATALCTIDGQQLAIGDSKVDFCVQSTCKTINYCMALEEHGEEHVHRYVGREPSGRGFNELTLNAEGRPHNPLINSGAILTVSMIKPRESIADRFQAVMETWEKAAGGSPAKFNNAVYLSERQTADRNFALGYFMREHKAFPDGTDLVETLEFYFQCCSLELNTEQMSIVAATLANGGVCPISGSRVFSTATVRNCLSLMYSCGMYDFSGEWAFTIGLPAKSGVGGGILVVVPNVLGLCCWSPRLDAQGNSVFGVDFCKRLISVYNFHNYDNLTGLSAKRDPRISLNELEAKKVDAIIWAASKGDLGAVQQQLVRGLDLNAMDYDRRTPLHLAAAEGRLGVVKYLIDAGADPNPVDRWNGTPLDDAYVHGHRDVVEFLETRSGVRKSGADVPSKEAPQTRPRLPGGTVNSVEMIYAAARGDLSAVRCLIARNVPMDCADYDLRTPLHLAAAENQTEVVRFFIDQGVDLKPRDRWGATPLDDARREGHEGVANLLEERGSLPRSA